MSTGTHQKKKIIPVVGNIKGIIKAAVLNFLRLKNTQK